MAPSIVDRNVLSPKANWSKPATVSTFIGTQLLIDFLPKDCQPKVYAPNLARPPQDATSKEIYGLSNVVNALRVLAADAIENAGCGHPGMVLGMAPAAVVLWDKHLKFNPCNPDWVNRDRFVLSAGHGSMLQYGLMHLYGYDSMPMEELKSFRKLGSRAAGHPENIATPGVEVTTGALGQGIANAVGLALAETHLAATYNRPGSAPVIDHRTYCIVGDGCLMEGIAAEAASLAGHWQLGKLTVLYDDNSTSIEGSTELAFTEDVGHRFGAYGWQVLRVPDGNTDLLGIDRALTEAKRCVDQPTLIIVTTTIGFGAPTKAGSPAAHGACLGASEISGLRETLSWPHAPFEIPGHVLARTHAKRTAGVHLERAWAICAAVHRSQHPHLGRQFAECVLRRTLPADWAGSLDELCILADSADAHSTRELSGRALNLLASRLPGLFGGSADLAPSTMTHLKTRRDYSARCPAGRNLHFGVREHAMGSIANGLALHASGLVPFAATFLVFSDYMRAAIRTAALAHAGTLFVLTHDSVLLGEDGPTHQPIEHLASLRAMPGVLTFRPAGAAEVAAAYEVAVARRDGPTALVLSRQRFAVAGTSRGGALRGAYALPERGTHEIADVLLIATGSEVALAQHAAKKLREQGVAVRVVSMPCVELFEEQPRAYRQQVLNVPRSRRMVVEAGSRFGWDRHAAHFCTVDRFGASGHPDELATLFGLTVENVVEKGLAVSKGVLIHEDDV